MKNRVKDDRNLFEIIAVLFSEHANLEREKRNQDAELMELRMENAQLRAGPDPQDIEAEVQRRVKEHLSKLSWKISKFFSKMRRMKNDLLGIRKLKRTRSFKE